MTDPERLLYDLHQLRAVGAQGWGIVRPTFSATDHGTAALAQTPKRGG